MFIGLFLLGYFPLTKFQKFEIEIYQPATVLVICASVFPFKTHNRCLLIVWIFFFLITDSLKHFY